MDTDHLRVFVEVMRKRSYALVARDRGVDPSSISRAISSLERQLRARLFHRSTRKLTPTDVALAWFEQVEPLVEGLESSIAAAADSGGRPRGLLRITAPVAFAQENLVPLLPGFARRYPQLDLELVLTDRFLDLVEDRIDVAVRLGRLRESSLVAKKLFDMGHVLCASPDYLRRRGRPKQPADLERHECLLYPITGYGSRWRFRLGAGPVLDVPVRGHVIISNGGALRLCALAGMGVLLLPRWHVARHLASGELVELMPEYQCTLSEFDAAGWVVYPSRSYLPLRVRAFVDYLMEEFRGGVPSARAAAPPRAMRSRRK